MTPRQWLIDARLRRNMSREDVAAKLGISTQLYTWLEIDDQVITHPHFALRIKNFFKLTNAQHNTMVSPASYLGERGKRT